MSCLRSLPPLLAAAETAVLGDPEGRVADLGKTAWTVSAGKLRVVGSRVEFIEPFDDDTSYYVAPPTYHGDWRRFATLRFSKKSAGGRYYPPDRHGAAGDVELRNGAMWARHVIARHHSGHYRTFTVPLGCDAWTLGGGAQTLADVLANVTALRIRAEYGDGRDRSGLGNVRLVPGAAPPASQRTAAAALLQPATVPLDDRPVAAAGASDWTVDLGRLCVAEAAIEHDAPGDGKTSYYIAPEHYHGDWRTYVQLEFDKKSSGGTYASPDHYGATGDVILRNGALFARHDIDDRHDGSWATYVIPLAEDAWKLGGGAQQFDDVLANVTDFRIRAEYGAGADSSGLRAVIRRP